MKIDASAKIRHKICVILVLLIVKTIVSLCPDMVQYHRLINDKIIGKKRQLNMMKKAYKIINIILIVFFSALILARLFYNLGAYGIMDLDEGKHAVEAYEMFKRNAWIAHTYYWEIDYLNSKPPMYYWMTNVFFRLFGISFVTFKLPSCIAAVITAVMVSVYLFRSGKKLFKDSAFAISLVTLFLGVFLSMDKVYDYHGFRAGNFDSIYTLFMLAGMIFMIKAREDNKYLIPMGVFAGLAFLSKGFNATTIVFSALLCIPFLAKKERIKYILYSVLAATLVVLPWAALRFRFDGTEFFYHMIFSEAEDKMIGGSLDYFRAFPELITFRLLFFGLIFYLVARMTGAGSVKEFFTALLSDLKENAILWIWFWVPILFYSYAGYCNEWYIYSSYVLAAVLFALHVVSGAKAIAGTKIYVKIAAALAVIVFLGISTADCIEQLGYYYLAGTGGGPAYQFWGDMKAIKEKYGDELQGSYVYMEDISRFDNVSVRHEVFYDNLAYAEFECDWHAMKGGIDAWENAEDGILIINKDLWEMYMDRLIGHVILEDNGYLYFSHDMY